MKKIAKKQHATERSSTKAAEAAPEIPMKTYAEPPAAPTAAPAAAAPQPTYPVPAEPQTQGGVGYTYPPVQQTSPYPPAAYQPPAPQYGQRPQYAGNGGGVRGQGEFTRITGLFAQKNGKPTDQVVLKRDIIEMLKAVSVAAVEGDRLGVSVDRNGRKFLWFMKVK